MMVDRWSVYVFHGEIEERVDHIYGKWVDYDDYAALEARVAELERDAARYRVVRDRILPEELNFDSALDESIGDEAISAAVDMAVDKAMEESK